MATSKEYKDFILEQLDLLDNITCKAMMGEFLLYYNNVLFGGIYDNRLLVKIVDTLEGIDVDSKYSFTSQDGYAFKTGINHMDGKEALSFSRERKNLPNGDKSRGENHQAVLTAIIKKSLTKNVLVNRNTVIYSIFPAYIFQLIKNHLL